jgi:hypothetical protein
MIVCHFTRHRMDLRGFKRLMQIQGWQDRRQPLCQHCLPTPRRPNQNCVVSPCCCNFQRSFDILLPPDICKIIFIIIQPREEFLLCIYNHPFQFSGIIKKVDDLLYVFHPVDFQFTHNSGLPGILFRKDDPLKSLCAWLRSR